MALGLKPGDEVITTPFTFAATAEMIVLLGGVPVFVDIEPDTCNIDAARIEAAITPRTRAIMPVSLYGQPADMDEINAIAARHGLPVIEDAAQSFGATYKGRKSCNLSTIGCTSFFPEQAARLLRRRRRDLHQRRRAGAGLPRDPRARPERALHAHARRRRRAHGHAAMRGRARQARALRVGARAAPSRSARATASCWPIVPGVRLLAVRADRDCVWAQYTVFVEHRAEVQAALTAQGIPTAVHYPRPLHRQPAYAHLHHGADLVHSEAAAEQVLSLPMSADLTHADQDRVVAALVRALSPSA